MFFWKVAFLLCLCLLMKVIVFICLALGLLEQVCGWFAGFECPIMGNIKHVCCWIAYWYLFHNLACLLMFCCFFVSSLFRAGEAEQALESLQKVQAYWKLKQMFVFKLSDMMQHHAPKSSCWTIVKWLTRLTTFVACVVGQTGFSRNICFKTWIMWTNSRGGHQKSPNWDHFSLQTLFLPFHFYSI